MTPVKTDYLYIYILCIYIYIYIVYIYIYIYIYLSDTFKIHKHAKCRSFLYKCSICIYCLNVKEYLYIVLIIDVFYLAKIRQMYLYDLVKDHVSYIKILWRKKDETLETVKKNLLFLNFVTTQFCYHTMLIFIIYFMRKGR